MQYGLLYMKVSDKENYIRVIDLRLNDVLS